MFGGPPPPSAAELKAQEEEAAQGIKMALISCVVLYLSPFAVEYAGKFV